MGAIRQHCPVSSGLLIASLGTSPFVRLSPFAKELAPGSNWGRFRGISTGRFRGIFAGIPSKP